MVRVQQEPIVSEEFLTRVKRLANYIKRSGEQDKADILLALFKVESTRQLAERSLTGILEGAGFHIMRLDMKDYQEADLVYLLLEKCEFPKDVFYLYHLETGGQLALNSLNYRRELLVEHGIKVVFWLEESRLQWLASGAPDFWAFRHRVVEFLELPEEEVFQIGRAHV